MVERQFSLLGNHKKLGKVRVHRCECCYLSQYLNSPEKPIKENQELKIKKKKMMTWPPFD